MLDPSLIEGFGFDFGNLPHLVMKHLQPADVWDVFYSDPIFAEDLTQGSGDRYMIGPVPGGYLTIVLTEANSGDPRMARPITGWQSSAREIEAYERNS